MAVRNGTPSLSNGQLARISSELVLAAPKAVRGLNVKRFLKLLSGHSGLFQEILTEKLAEVADEMECALPSTLETLSMVSWKVPIDSPECPSIEFLSIPDFTIGRNHSTRDLFLEAIGMNLSSTIPPLKTALQSFDVRSSMTDPEILGEIGQRMFTPDQIAGTLMGLLRTGPGDGSNPFRADGNCNLFYVKLPDSKAVVVARFDRTRVRWDIEAWYTGTTKWYAGCRVFQP